MLIKIGHRGAMGYEPENTLRSFQKAIDLGADMIELDVHICKSGEPVVIHDETLWRTAWRPGRVAEKTLAELKRYNVGKPGSRFFKSAKRHSQRQLKNSLPGKSQRVPTLSEVIELVNRQAIVNIELKGQGTAGPVNSLINDYLKRGWLLGDFMVSSFDFGELVQFRKLNPDIWLGAVFSKTPADIFEFTKEIRAKSIRPSIKCVSQHLIDEAHGKGLKVFVWTANTFEEINKLKTMGVDGIFSDYPDRL